MIPREILQKALADYEKAVEDIQGMGNWEAKEYLCDNEMRFGLCFYLKVKFDVKEHSLGFLIPSNGVYLGGTRVVAGYSNSLPTLTARLQLRIDKLKELLNDNPLPLPK